MDVVAFSPNGKKVFFSGRRDRTPKLSDISTGKDIKTFRGHSDGVTSVAVSVDGSKVLSGSLDKTLKLWDFNSHKIKIFRGHSDIVISVAISGDGSKVFSGSRDKTLKLWDVSTGKEIRTVREHSKSVESVAISADGSKILSGSSDKTLIWDVSTGKAIRRLYHAFSISSVAISADGSKVLSGSRYVGSYYQTLKLWDVSTGKEIGTFRGHRGVQSVAISADDSKIISGSYNMLHFLDVSTGKEIRTFRGHSDIVISVAISSDGNILSGSYDDTLKLWDVSTGKAMRTFRGHSDNVTSVVCPDGNILSGSKDGTIRLWNAKTGEEIAQLISLEVDEWVMITTEGYYSSSLNGAKYINVRIGNKVYGIDQYEKIYHRPDIVKLAIKLGDSQQAIARLTRPVQMAAVQPPVLWFFSPKDGYETYKDSIEVQLKTENIADPAVDILFRINQRPLGKERGKPVRPTSSGAKKIRTYKKTIPLLAGHNWIEAEVRAKA